MEKPTKKPFVKPTKAEIARRVELIYKPLLYGLREPDICDYLRQMGHTWVDDVDRSTMYRYIAMAIDLQAEAAKPDRRFRLRQQLARMDDAYALARSKKDVAGCVSVSDRISKLIGLDKPSPAVAKDIITEIDRAMAQREKEREVNAADAASKEPGAKKVSRNTDRRRAARTAPRTGATKRGGSA